MNKTGIAIKAVLFLMLSIMGWNLIQLDYFIELHEIGHMKAFDNDGVRNWRHDLWTVHADRYTVNGIMGGHREVFYAVLLVYVALFIFCFSQYWILGPVMGLLLRSYHHPWEGTDFYKVPSWTNRIWNQWTTEEGLYLAIAILAFLIFKIGPELYYLKTGKKISIFPQKKGPKIES